MSDPAGPFDPNASMFFAAPGEENLFSKTPANVSGDFVKEAQQNASSATSSNARSVRDPGSSTPRTMPSRSISTAAPTTTKKRMRPIRVNNADTYPESNTAAVAAARTPAAVPAITDLDLPPPKKKRNRQPGTKQLNARVIPRSLDECEEADKELISLRESGSEWKAIRIRWEELTGEKTATSTLPNRYARLKSNFTVIKEEDNGHLLSAKKRVEESFEAQKWELIARVVEEKGGEKYAPVVLQRQYKKIMVGSGAVPPPGVEDPDFEIELPEADDE